MLNCIKLTDVAGTRSDCGPGLKAYVEVGTRNRRMGARTVPSLLFMKESGPYVEHAKTVDRSAERALLSVKKLGLD